MIAAAALGFLGSKATAFVAQTPAGAQPRSATTHAAGAAQAAPQVSQASAKGAFCAGSVAGLASAGAVAASKRRARASCKAGFDPTKAVGALEPTGFWDPCGCMKQRVGKDGWEWKDEEAFKKYRAAELKHGRVCMLAATGMITTSFWHFPSFEGVPDGVAALQTSEGGAGFGIIFLVAAGIELKVPDGNFSDPLGLGSQDNWGYTDKMKNMELANGRVAMSAVLTFFLYEYGEKLSPPALLAETNWLNFALPLTLLGMALGNAEGWAKGEYTPSLMATGGTLYPSEGEPTAVNLSAKLPASLKEAKKIEAMATA